MAKKTQLKEETVQTTVEDLTQAHVEQAHEAAIALDALLCAMNVPVHVAVNAVSSVMVQAMGQMYATAYHDPSLHEQVSELAEQGVFRIVRDIQKLIHEKGLTPNITVN